MAAPSRESTGRLVTDSTFTLPYAYPSSADYSIESQFDDVPGPCRRQRGTRASTTLAILQGRTTRRTYEASGAAALAVPLTPATRAGAASIRARNGTKMGEASPWPALRLWTRSRRAIPKLYRKR